MHMKNEKNLPGEILGSLTRLTTKDADKVVGGRRHEQAVKARRERAQK